MSEQENRAEIVDEKSEEVSPRGEETIVLARQVLPLRLQIVPLVNRPFFPKMMVPIVVEEARIKKMIGELVESESKHIGLVSVRPHEQDPTQPSIPIKSKDIYRVGVVGEIVQAAQATPDAPMQCVVAVRERFQIESVVREEPTIMVQVKYLIETDMSVNEELKAYSLAIIDGIKELMRLSPLFKEEMTLLLSRSNVNEPGRLADFAASMTTASVDELQDILESFNIPERVRKVLLLLKKEIEVSKLQVKISKQIEERLSKQQREFFLREQLKEIKKELGISKEGKEAEIERFKQRLEKLTLTEEAQQRIDEEMEKLALMEPASPEFNVSRTYLDWLTILPWGVFTKDNYDINKAQRVLDQDHFGLEDVKQRILEFLSVGIMKGNISGSIICFVGPPGVGKTSIGKSIARSVGRQFYRFSVGGMRDEAEIKGHRRTYVGALPGKFLQAMKVCKTANPVIMIDEIDKLTTSFQGDPAAALLEVLDPEQNRDFLDHYLDVRFDLSNVFFLCTANQLDTIPRPLLDRMEVIKLSGYILEEKLEIAKRFLIPKQLKEHGLQAVQLAISQTVLKEIIDGYAREPGVRGLENQIKKIVRKSVKRMVETKEQRITISQGEIRELLGKKLFQDEEIYRKSKPGVVMGLAWTSLGGDTLFVEATPVKTGNAGFKQTGQLGNVMVESSEIAYTFARSLLRQKNDKDRFFDEHFIHLHVPAGATPKDGPSAGVTMATALYSLALNKPVKSKLAMTGELSLTGLVMPVGGIKEKTIAAKRAKVKQIILPKQNQPDFEELPAHIRKGLTPYFVSEFEEVIKICL
ncbi:MAG: endopeptidase La [Deltaproteobacteria bacterium]|nr:endopeptidase La [Deltaproteobacteria bacterium]